MIDDHPNLHPAGSARLASCAPSLAPAPISPGAEILCGEGDRAPGAYKQNVQKPQIGAPGGHASPVPARARPVKVREAQRAPTAARGAPLCPHEGPECGWGRKFWEGRRRYGSLRAQGDEAGVRELGQERLHVREWPGPCRILNTAAAFI